MLTVLLLAIFPLISAECHLKTEPGFPNRTICTVEKLETDDPLKFKKQKNPEYLYIDVSYGEIPKDAFSKLKSHKELWFLGENITFIQPGAFRNLSDLQNLAITNTLIQEIAPKSFAGVPNLQALSLVRNRISAIEDGAFEGLENLQQLLLNHNNITRVNETTFEGLEGVMSIQLVDNPIEFVHKNAFRNLGKLNHLTISVVEKFGDGGRNKTAEAWDFLDPNRVTVKYL